MVNLWSAARSSGGRWRRSKSLSIESLEIRELMAADMVLEWNQHLIDAIRVDTTQPGPGWSSRNMGIVQAAVYDAVNAIEQSHTPFMTSIVGAGNESIEAAVASAARTALAGLYPEQALTFKGLFKASLLEIQDSQTAEDAGAELGRRVATEILAMRADDNAVDDFTFPYTPIDEPGHYAPQPGQTAWGPGWGLVTPFYLESASQFPLPAPPALDSQEYADALNDVKAYGAIDSAVRTPEQTDIGNFWAYDRGGMGPPPLLYNQIAQEIAIDRGNTLSENARLFAIINLAMADAGIACWEEKFKYDVWRPIDAVREADTDGNPDTVADADWVPLGAPGNTPAQNFTPPFPSYASGHATFGAAAFKSLANFYGIDYEGNEYTFTATSNEMADDSPNHTRTFHSFKEAAEENGRSRIYLGIHFEFDNQQGQAQGVKIADYLAENFLLPRTDDNGDAVASVSVQSIGGGFQSVPLPAGSTDITLRRKGDKLAIVDDATAEFLFIDKLANIQAVRLDMHADVPNSVIVNFAAAGNFEFPGGVQYLGGAGAGDHLRAIGGENANFFHLDGSLAKLDGLTVALDEVEWVTLSGAKGDDLLAVSGDQEGVRVELDGNKGDDTYELAVHDSEVSLWDKRGVDAIDVSASERRVSIDLSLDGGQRQFIDAGFNWLRLEGVFERVYGTAYNDFIRGNAAPNLLWGFDGHDVLLGLDGDDELYGGNGNDVLIGGRGDDTLVGGEGGDVLVAGFTSYDANQTALLSILDEWKSSRPKDIRVENLTFAVASTVRRVGYALTEAGQATVFTDGARDSLFADKNDWIPPARRVS